jgi:hypothetical protein
MTTYAIALFLHVAGAIGIFVALALEAVSLAGVRRAATVEQVREWAGITSLLRSLGGASMALLVIPGIYMAVTNWRGEAWPWIGLAALALVPALGIRNGLRLMRAQQAAATASGPIDAALHGALADPLLQLSIRTRLGVALGIVFIMTAKPGPGASVAAIAVAAVLGALSRFSMRHARSTSQGTVGA